MRLLADAHLERGEAPDWTRIESALGHYARQMSECPQDPVHHPEGDVWTHTRMVVESILDLESFWAEPADNRRILFVAALLHDIAKPFTTREEAGRIISPGHSTKGAKIGRQILWEEHAPFSERERVLSLVRWHMVPAHLLGRENATELAIRLSIVSEPRLLKILAEADARGRAGGGLQDALERLAMFEELLRDLECWDGPFPFANDTSRFEFFRTPGRNPYHVAYEDPRCTVTVMSGLPASGKDTWLALNRPELPVISRDAIREEIGAKPGEAEGKVTAVAAERAREYLRKRQDFAWDTTALGRDIRERMIGLLAAYNARIEIQYLEGSPEAISARNAARENPVPMDAIEKMLRHWDVPDVTEAHAVEYHLTQ